MNEPRYIDYKPVFDRQTGTNAEICIIIGARSIGKTFTLRLELTKRHIKDGLTYVVMSRTKEESQALSRGFFDKLQSEGFLLDWKFKVEKGAAYVAPANVERPEWRVICYFISLTTFQRDKQTTFANVREIIFDEALIDKRDRYHHYLPYEYSLFADCCSTVFREQPNDGISRHVFILGNACDLTAPYMREYGIEKPPDYGFSWYKDKTVLLWYVEPWDAEARKAHTLVGRMLAGSDAARVAFDNQFDTGSDADIARKSAGARFAFAVKYQVQTFAVWIDYQSGITYVNEQVPKDAAKPYALTKKDGAVDYRMLRKSDDLLTMISNLYYAGNVRYSSPALREAFLEVLSFIGIK